MRADQHSCIERGFDGCAAAAVMMMMIINERRVWR